MLELSLEQMKRLAGIAYQDLPLEANFRGQPLIPRDDGGYVVFSPDINGTTYEQAQALRVIVAAFNLPGLVGFERHVDLAIVKRYASGTMLHNFCGNDLLHASALALLGDKA